MKNKTCKTNTNLEEAVKAIATRMSEQIGLVAASSLREMLFMLMEERENGYAQVSEDQNEFPTAGEVAKILKISRALAYRMMQTRQLQLPSFSIGRTVRVRRDDLDAFIDSHMLR